MYLRIYFEDLRGDEKILTFAVSFSMLEEKGCFDSKMKNERTSNLELYRIMSMLMIIAHHFVVNSELNTIIYYDLWNRRSLFYLVFSSYGKTGINCFLMITGYYMCKQEITLRKFVKLYGEILFYRVIIDLIFIMYGYQDFSFGLAIKRLLPFSSIGSGFTSGFTAFWLSIPFINIFLNNVNEKQHIKLISLLVTIYVVLGTLSFTGIFVVTMNYFSWFIVIYITASFFRLYPKPLWDNMCFWGVITSLLLVISVISIVYETWRLSSGEGLAPDYWLSGPNKIFAYGLGISSFLFFKNLSIPNSKIINAFGGSTFGVLLIHANSDAMRRWLWDEIVKTGYILFG